MITLDLWNYDEFWVNQINATVILSSLLFIFVFNRYYKIKRAVKILSKTGEGIMIMVENKMKVAINKPNEKGTRLLIDNKSGEK